MLVGQIVGGLLNSRLTLLSRLAAKKAFLTRAPSITFEQKTSLGPVSQQAYYKKMDYSTRS